MNGAGMYNGTASISSAVPLSYGTDWLQTIPTRSLLGSWRSN